MQMGKDEYLRTQVRLVGIGNTLDTLDLVGFVNAAKAAEEMGPAVDPTLYQRGIESLVAMREFAEAAQRLRLAFKKVKVTVLLKPAPDVPPCQVGG